VIVRGGETRRCHSCGARLSRFNEAATCAPCGRATDGPPSRPSQARPPQPAVAEACAWTTDAGSDWLWIPDLAHHVTDVVDIGEVLRAYRATHGLTQAELAEVLGFTQSYVSKIERARRPARDVETLKRIAQRLSIPPIELGVTPAALEGAGGGRAVKGQRPRLAAVDDAGSVADRQVHTSQRQWRLVRQCLNQRRAELAAVATGLYPGTDRRHETALLLRSDWIPPVPVELGAIDLRWTDDVRTPDEVRGTEPEASSTRPLLSVERRYERYTRAIRDIDQPTLFENRVGYRLLDLHWEHGSGSMVFGGTTYFDMVDVCEAVAHELAFAWAQEGGSHHAAAVRLSRLPFRQRIGDPFDLRRRPVLPSIDTLTIRRGAGSAAFILHFRDPGQVAMAGGLFQVLPSGMFQPASISPLSQACDFDIWRNIMREYSEEFLGNDEHDGSTGTPIDYARSEPFRSLNAAREAGRLRALCLGVGVDPLTLAGEILTVVVIDDDVFGEVFADLVRGNSEGAVVSAGRTRRVGEGIPFTYESLERLVTREPIAPAASACLQLAWTNRDALLTA
jgi:transcriptional regulator with XRE-family HTH domain